MTELGSSWVSIRHSILGLFRPQLLAMVHQAEASTAGRVLTVGRFVYSFPLLNLILRFAFVRRVRNVFPLFPASTLSTHCVPTPAKAHPSIAQPMPLGRLHACASMGREAMFLVLNALDVVSWCLQRLDAATRR